jgi:hypothetical protein
MGKSVLDQHGIQPDGNAHGTDEQFELYALHRLPDSQQALLEEHLMVCAGCRDKLDSAGDFALGMRVASLARRPERSVMVKLGSFVRRPAFSMALGFAALLIAIAVFSNLRTPFAPAASLQLTATRGEMPLTVPARTFKLTLTDGPREGGPFKVEVLNATGRSLWSGLADSSPGGVEVSVEQPLPQGDYFVRLHSASGKMLREYGFRVRG